MGFEPVTLRYRCDALTNWAKSHSTSFPGSLFSASLSRWNRDPCCGCSRDHISIRNRRAGGTQLHLVERTIKYHPGEGKLFWCLVLKHDFSTKTNESSDIPLSPCLSKLVTVTIKNPVAPPFQQIFQPPRFWVVTWPAATRVSVPTTKGGREERPGNEVESHWRWELVICGF